MQGVARAWLRGSWLLLLALAAFLPARAESKPAVESRFADVNGTRLHYLVAGRGEPVILIHGYTQSSHMWRPLIAEEAPGQVIPTLRGLPQPLIEPGSRSRAALRSKLTCD